MISLKKLKYKIFNLREYKKLSKEELLKYKTDFEENRVLPILVKGNIVIDGMQRVETAKILKLTKIEATRI